jgi:hypothetical protein
MTHFWLGVAVAVVGLLLVIFNRQFVNALPPAKGPAAQMRMFQPGPNGRVPMLTAVALGWIVIGVVFVWIAATGQPL